MPRSILLIALFLAGWPGLSLLAGPIQHYQLDERTQVYTAQVEDTLAGLADKYYRDRSAWPAIWQATNARAPADERIDRLLSPNVIRPGQLLLIPGPETMAQYLTEFEAKGGSVANVARPVTLNATWLADFTDYVGAGYT
jgi:LysM repeat protein